MARPWAPERGRAGCWMSCRASFASSLGFAVPVPCPDPGPPARQGRLLEELPRELCEYLKVSAVVRSAAAALGGTIYDRLRINAVYALQARPPLTQQQSALPSSRL